MWFMELMEEPSKFSVGQTAQSLTCAIMEKSLAGLDDCLNMLLPCHAVEKRDILFGGLDILIMWSVELSQMLHSFHT